MRVFRNNEIEYLFREEGFVKYGNISQETIKELTALYNQLNIPDFFGCGYNCGMNSDQHKLRKIMQDRINELIYPYTKMILDDYYHYTATFVNKSPKKDCFVVAHQDFSYTEEPQHPSFMCFIPLVDVSIQNAALGFIPKSHLFYDTIRAFPFPCGKTPVTENDTTLMPYFNIIDMKSGEMVFFNQNTIHGSFSNYGNTDRLALSISFVKNGQPIFSFIHNPENNGKTILKYEVDKYAIAYYNNPAISKMYNIWNIHLPYKLVDELVYPEQDTSWSNIKCKLDKYNINPNPKLEELLIKNRNKKTPTTKFFENIINKFQKKTRNK